MATSSRLCRAMAFSSGPLRLSSAAVRSAGAMRFQPAVHGPAFSRNFRCDFSGWCTGADQYPCKVRRCLPAQLNIDLQGGHYWSHACSTVLMTVWYSCCMNGLHAHDTYTLRTSPFGASSADFLGHAQPCTCRTLNLRSPHCTHWHFVQPRCTLPDTATTVCPCTLRLCCTGPRLSTAWALVLWACPTSARCVCQEPALLRRLPPVSVLVAVVLVSIVGERSTWALVWWACPTLARCVCLQPAAVLIGPEMVVSCEDLLAGGAVL